VPGDRPPKPAVTRLPVKVSIGSTLLVIGAVVAAIAVADLFQAARRPIAWVLATSIVAWLLSAVIAVLARRMPRPVALVLTVLGVAILAAGAWIGVRATIKSEVDHLRTSLPRAARDLETRHKTAANFHLADRAQSFVNNLDERFGTHAAATAAATTASTYIVTGILMLFLLGYGPRFVAGALRQIADDEKRATIEATLFRASDAARSYLLYALAQALAIASLCSAVFYLLDLPAPFILGLLVGGLGTIPYFGVVLGGFAPLLAAATDPHKATYIILIAMLLVLQCIEAIVIRPQLDRRTLRVGPTLILVAIVVGFELYGFGGALYTVAVLVFLSAVLHATPNRSTPTQPDVKPP
jgi:predicted PurR-regulated permease PerM